MVDQATPHLSATRHAGGLHCFVTDASRMDELAPRFLGEPIDSLELVDL